MCMCTCVQNKDLESIQHVYMLNKDLESIQTCVHVKIRI